MTNNATHMRIEIEEIPEAARRLLGGSADALLQAGLALRQLQPVMVATKRKRSAGWGAAPVKSCPVSSRTRRSRPTKPRPV